MFVSTSQSDIFFGQLKIVFQMREIKDFAFKISVKNHNKLCSLKNLQWQLLTIIEYKGSLWFEHIV